MAELTLTQTGTQTQEMRHEQTMTHQQIQALELLAAPVMDLKAAVNTELQRNPALEDQDSMGEDGESVQADEGDEQTSDQEDEEQWLEKLLQVDDHMARPGRTYSQYSAQDEEKRQYFFDSIEEPRTFQDDLMSQLDFLELSNEVRQACETVLSGLDDEAYLTTHPADLAMASGLRMDLIQQGIEIAKSLSPPGIAATDLRERFLMQLEREGEIDSLTYQAVYYCMEDLANNRLPKVAQKLNITIEDCRDVLEKLRTLNPRIKTDDDIHPHEYVEEEATVTENASGELEVHVNDHRIPTLNISPRYRELLSDPNLNKQTRDYLKEKIRAAASLINSLSQRQDTLKKILEAVLEVQRGYFLKGADYLKPLTMADIAEKVGVHETTVSRAVSGKFIRCKYGLVSINNFFSAGYRSDNGEEVSSNVVKNAIKRYIDQESPKKPFSDSKLTKKLKEEGLHVARRTVAKYRESMGIVSSNLRRKH